MLKARKPEAYRERLDARYTANMNIQSAVRVIHEYHNDPPSIDVSAADTSVVISERLW